MPIRNSSSGQFEPLANSVADPKTTRAAYGPDAAVARYKLKKQIRDADILRGTKSAALAGGLGAVAGALTGSTKSRAIRAMIGAGTAAGSVGLIRAGTASTRDVYGDRTRTAKAAEALPAVGALGLAGALVARKVRGKLFSARPLQERKSLPAAVKAGLSAAASGAALGLIPAFRRGTGIRTVLKSVGTGAGLGAVIGGGGTAIGEAVMGKPTADEGAPITKRAAIGGGIAGALGGLTAGVLALKSSAGRRALVKASKTWRPALWARKGGLPLAAGIGALGGGIAGAAHGADEGQQVDTLNAMKQNRARKSAALTFEAAFAGAKTFGLSDGQATVLAAEADREGYLRNLAARGLIREI